MMGKFQKIIRRFQSGFERSESFLLTQQFLKGVLGLVHRRSWIWSQS